MVYLTRKVDFCAAHRLWDASLSEAENRRRFGRCANLHGHNYTLEVTYAGEPDPTTGMLVHLTDLKRIIEERVVDELDHKNLGEDVPVFRDVPASAEMIAKYAWDRLDGAVPGARLHRVRLQEDRALSVDYFGGEE
jgi:6-pyruvoyltetrahydropterin/6-carboxytetrahydropterin synthase